MFFVVSLAFFSAVPFDFALALAFAFWVFVAGFFLLEADLGAGVAKLSKNCLQTAFASKPRRLGIFSLVTSPPVLVEPPSFAAAFAFPFANSAFFLDLVSDCASATSAFRAASLSGSKGFSTQLPPAGLVRRIGSFEAEGALSFDPEDGEYLASQSSNGGDNEFLHIVICGF